MSEQAESVLRVQIEPALTGAACMRGDAELLEAHTDDTPVTLRLYTWIRPTVSVGFMQKPEELLDLDACSAGGIDVVRRPTGGRAILHWEEITYAVVASARDGRFGTNLASAHDVIGECLAAALGRLGIAAELSRPGRDPRRLGLRQPCFASTGRSELLVGGRKLVGSAQRRRAHAFLQHGSLLIGPAHEGLVDLLRDARRDACVAAEMQDRLRRDTTTLRALLGRDPDFAELAGALVAGFCTRLGLAPEPVLRFSGIGTGVQPA
jgi:lipoate-protein ligase A